MPTVYRPPKNPPPAPKQPSKIRTAIAVGVLLVGGLIYFLKFGAGHVATKAELAGHWMHMGDGITVELFFDANGKYHRLPKGMQISGGGVGTSIPESGTYFLDDKGHLGFASGGSFIASVNGSRLTLQADGVTPTVNYVFSKVDGG